MIQTHTDLIPDSFIISNNGIAVGDENEQDTAKECRKMAGYIA